MSEVEKLSNWGNYPVVEAKVYTESFYEPIKKMVLAENQLIARGLGKCYGDASLQQVVFSSDRLNKLLAFDAEKGIITCQSGVSLYDVLHFCVPQGFFLSVTPGTKYITVGGAIAADVHGKNHHKEGSFSQFLESFLLMDEKGNLITCTKQENADLFWRTCGGMGQTGIILEASFRLKPIETSFIKLTTIKAKNIEETMDLFSQYEQYTYSVAWLDCLSKGESLGRSILTFGEHARKRDLPKKYQKEPLLLSDEKKKLKIPIQFPSFVLNNLSVKLFNFLYYNKTIKKESDAIVHYEPFFYPLDVLLDWNKIYGKNGFLQYQCVIPIANSRKAIPEIIRFIGNRNLGSFLTVLKLLGPKNQAPLNFPIEGYTLAIDFKIDKQIFAILEELDALVLSYGGKIYLAKDARLTKENFEKMYGHKFDNQKFVSSLMNRFK